MTITHQLQRKKDSGITTVSLGQNSDYIQLLCNFLNLYLTQTTAKLIPKQTELELTQWYDHRAFFSHKH
jgi:hypothetical protein